MVLDHHSSELDSHWGVDANNAEREGHRGNSLLRFLVTTTSQQLPRQYFRLRIRRDPVAPVSSLLWGYSFEVILSTAALAVLLWYYASNGGAPFPLTTEIVNTVKEAGMGWTCKVLSPKKGTVYYSTLNSENAQFASPYENYLDVAQCKATLTKNGVCNDGLRYDHLSVLGVTNTNNSQYYTSGHFSFTPTQTQGLSSELAAFYGKSVAFPQPAVVGQSFPGTETTFYVYNFLRNTAANAFSSYPGVHVSSMLRDALTNLVYDPAKGSTSRDFDLASSSAGPVASSSNKIQALQKALNISDAFGVVDVGVFNGVYYGIKYESLFNAPTAVAATSQCLENSMGHYFRILVADYDSVDMYRSNEGTIGYQSTYGLFQSNGNPALGQKSIAIKEFTSCPPVPSPTPAPVYAVIGSSILSAVSSTADLGSFTTTPTQSSSVDTVAGASSIAVDAAGGDVWVTNYGSKIWRISSGVSQLLTLTAHSPSNYPVSGIVARGIAVWVAVTTTVPTPISTDLRGVPTGQPSGAPTGQPTTQPSFRPTTSEKPTASPTPLPTASPSPRPTEDITVPSTKEYHVYVSDGAKNTVIRFIVRGIGATVSEGVTDIGSLASPAFFEPSGLAVDRRNEYVYVADKGNNLIRRIELSSGIVTTLGDSASPSFNAPIGVALDFSGNIYVADTGNNFVRKIDGQTGEMSTRVGRLVTPELFSYDTKSAGGWRPSWTPPSRPETKWGGTTGDTAIFRQTRLDAISPIDPGGCQNLEAFYLVPLLQGVKPNCFALVHSEYNAQTAHLYLEFQQFKYVYPRITPDSTRILVLDTAVNTDFLYNFKIAALEAGRQLWGVVKTEKYGVVLYTSAGAVGENPNPGIKVTVNSFTTVTATTSTITLTAADLSNKLCGVDVIYQSNTPCFEVGSVVTGSGIPTNTRLTTPFNDNNAPGVVTLLVDRSCTGCGSNSITATGTVILTFYRPDSTNQIGTTSIPPPNQTGMEVVALAGYNSLVQAEGTTVIDGSIIPGASPRYLLLKLNQKGLVSAFTYDTQTDTYFSNTAAAAPTHYMIAYTYGICSGETTRSLVELTFSNDYSNQCQLPSTGLYYQSPNQYFAIPFGCLGIAYDKLLTDCPEVKANMAALVTSTCQASIDKVCTTQYTQNPPFACSKPITPSPLTVISLAGSNTMALASLVATLVALFLGRRYKNYVPSAEDLSLVNSAETLAVTTPSGKVYKAASLSMGGSETMEETKPSAAFDDRVEEMMRKIASLEKQIRGGSVAVHVTSD